MMSEDLFYNKVKETMHGYAPEVPASVYGGMRKKYARSKFFSWNASTLNVWYVALVAIMGAVAYGSFPSNEMKASKASTINMNVEHLPAAIASSQDLIVTCDNASDNKETVLKHYKGEPCLFPSSLVEVKNEIQINEELKIDPEVSEVTTPEKEAETIENIESAPVIEEKVEVAPKKPTRKIKAPVYKDKQ